MKRPKKRPRESELAESLNRNGDEHCDDARQQSSDIRTSTSWVISPVYTDGCKVSVGERGVVIISQTRLMEHEAQIELVPRELVSLIQLLPDVLRTAHANEKEACGTSIH